MNKIVKSGECNLNLTYTVWTKKIEIMSIFKLNFLFSEIVKRSVQWRTAKREKILFF